MSALPCCSAVYYSPACCNHKAGDVVTSKLYWGPANIWLRSAAWSFFFTVWMLVVSVCVAVTINRGGNVTRRGSHGGCLMSFVSSATWSNRDRVLVHLLRRAGSGGSNLLSHHGT